MVRPANKVTAKVIQPRSARPMGSLLSKEITARKLEDKIELKAAFCLGKCGCDGVSIKVGDKIVTGVNPSTFKSIFETEVLPLVH